MEKMHTYRQAIVFLVIVQYCSAIGYASDEAGCSHNGTMFADGSLVPSLEPCLNCKCVDSHLKCSLRVCPEQPIPPPRGCVLVHKRSACCPHVSCKKYHNENESSNRRVIAYNSNWYDDDNAESRSGDDEDKRHKVLSKNSLYRRIEDEETEGNDEMCVHNGTIYRTGSAMSTSSLCSYCYCIGGKQKCVRPKCLITSPGCVPVFIDTSCCPIRYDCKDVTSSISTSVKPKTILTRIENKHYNRMRSRAQRNRGCLVASTYYAEGEKLPANPKKPCDLCFCIRGESKCTPKKCAPYIGNCKPRIPEGQCCPAHYECDHTDEQSLESDHRPRQFDLFSYFFNEDTPENETNSEPSDRPQFLQQQDYSSPVSSTSEKSFLDALRDGLNYIDSNDEHVEKILEPIGVNASTVATTTNRPLHINKTEPSFLDLLLSDVSNDDDDDDEDYDDDDKIEAAKNPWQSHQAPHNLSDIATVYVSNLSDAELHHNRYALLDEPSTSETTAPIFTDSVKYSESWPSVKTSNYDRSATEKIISEYITYTSVPSYNYDTSTTSTSADLETTTLIESTTPEHLSITPPREETIDSFGDDRNSSTSNPTEDDFSFSGMTSTKDETSTKLQESSTQFAESETGQTTTTTTTTEAGLVSAFLKEFSNIFGDVKTDNRLETENQKVASTLPDITKIKGPTQVSSTPNPIKITNRVNPTIIPPPAYTYATSPMPVVTVTSSVTRTTPTPTETTTAPSSTATKSPTTVTVHPKLTSKTTQPTTQIPVTTTTSSTTTLKPSHTTKTTPKINVHVIHSTSEIEHLSTTEDNSADNQPPLIDANPSILDSDLNYDYDQPTLPPSLPNLKIIPFLPADAVRKDNVHPKLEYYSPISTSYPVLTENYESPYLGSSNSENHNADFTAFEVNEPEAKDNPDFNSYSIRTAGYSNDDIFGIPKTNGESLDYSQYPSITEKPSVEPTIHNKYAGYNVDYDYDPFDKDHKYAPGSYEILDGHDYNIQGRNPSFDKFVTEYPERHVHSKIEFSTSNPLYGFSGNNKFSPPSKTEGGFLPKEPSPEDDQYYEKLHTTKHAPDLLTEPSPKSNATAQLIGITSEDPFKNVIRTEPPPNLDTLIEDKEKLFHTVPELTATNIDHDYPSIHLSDIEKEIISITTDANYSPLPEYESESLTDSIEYSLHHFDNDSSVSSLPVDSNKPPTNSSVSVATEISVGSVYETNPTTELASKDFLGSLLGYIFKDNKINSEPTETTIPEQTIPPFKKISSTSLSLMDILNFTKPVENSSKKAVIPQRKNNKIYEYPTTSDQHEETSTPPREENLNILRDVLLATLNNPSHIDPIAHGESHPTIDVPKPIYSSHSIHQFLNPIFAGNSDLTHVTSKYSPISSDIDLTIPKLNSQIGDNKDELNNNVFGPESYQVLSDYPSTSNHKPFGENPIDYDALKEHHSDDNSPGIYKKKPLNGFQNSMGMLKLAGCNIYGRMYRVGRIITELSNPCLECKCTEVGVHCTTLSC